jgi:hypothetical protein
MTRIISPGVMTDDLPEDTSKPIDKTQFPDHPCDPSAIHDLYPAIGTKNNPLPIVPK